jgi:hypothetical protein
MPAVAIASCSTPIESPRWSSNVSRSQLAHGVPLTRGTSGPRSYRECRRCAELIRGSEDSRCPRSIQPRRSSLRRPTSRGECRTWRRRAVSRRLSWRAARITNGNYLVLMKWYPGWMSAAHLRDGPFVRRAAGGVVVQWRPGLRSRSSGPGPPWGFVRRVAGTRTTTGRGRMQQSLRSLRSAG